MTATGINSFNLYTLDEHDNPVRCNDPLAWVKWRHRNENKIIVARTVIASQTTVTTQFLCEDRVAQYRMTGHHRPVLWSTIISGWPDDDLEFTYTSLDDARAGHSMAVRRAYESFGGW